MRQNTSAVLSQSYFAEWASSLSKEIPAAWQARARTVCPNARPHSVAVSNAENGWNGFLLMPHRREASFRNAWSKEALCATIMAREQPVRLISARIALKESVSASFSGTAIRKGWSGSMPVNSSAEGSIFEPANGSMLKNIRSPGTRSPSSFICGITIALSSNASVL